MDVHDTDDAAPLVWHTKEEPKPRTVFFMGLPAFTCCSGWDERDVGESIYYNCKDVLKQIQRDTGLADFYLNAKPDAARQLDITLRLDAGMFFDMGHWVSPEGVWVREAMWAYYLKPTWVASNLHSSPLILPCGCKLTEEQVLQYDEGALFDNLKKEGDRNA